MRDFSLHTYGSLLDALMGDGFKSLRFRDLICGDHEVGNRFVVLRHDVDKLPWNSVRTAELEARRGMHGTYYFRVVPGAWDVEAIRAIADLGHECGYHYEDMDLAKGDVDKAYLLFQQHLGRLREVVPVQTICMHGSPMSRWDNRDLWGKFDYRAHDIIGEPYLDLDYNEIFYVSDTGRSWNATDVSIRDKVMTKFDIRIESTAHFVDLLRSASLPGKMMINTHPQRWSSGQGEWVRELVMQNAKNLVKRALVARRIASSS